MNFFIAIADFLLISFWKLRAILPFSSEYIPVQKKGDIVLIQGINTRASFLMSLAKFLSSNGWAAHLVPDLGMNWTTIPESGRIVYELIKKNDLRNVILMGHSKGGLVGKYVLSNLDSEQRVRGMIGLATPFSGTEASRLIPSKAYHEFLPESPMVEELRNHREVNNKIITIYPVYDNMIKSPDQGSLDGALDNIIIPKKCHNIYLFTKDARQQILKSLDRLNQS